MNVTTNRLRDGDVRLTLDGELDLSTVEKLDDAVAIALTGGQARRLIVDLGCVTFCDSTGVRALVEGSAPRPSAASQPRSDRESGRSASKSGKYKEPGRTAALLSRELGWD